MKPLTAIGFLVLPAVWVLAEPAEVRSPAPTPPPAQSLRGLPPREREKAERRNADALFKWLESLSVDQRAAWHAAVGTMDWKARRRIGEQHLPAADSGYSWRSAAAFCGLKADEIARLGTDKLLIEDVSFEQSFSPYIEPRRPVFITSDSLLNGFHVLFEDSFRELEVRRAFQLRQHLETVLSKARELLADIRRRSGYRPEELTTGWRHAQLVLGPALRLLGSKPDIFDPEVRDEIERQLVEIRTAEIQALPAWLGPPSRTLISLDYRRFKPIGFYTQTESLQNYFRAVLWLQSIPFRADRDDELTAIGLLGMATAWSRDGNPRSFFRAFALFLARPDDPDLGEAASEFVGLFGGARRKSWKEALASTRDGLLRSQMKVGELGKLNDANRLPLQATEKPAEIQFRVLSAYRLPDSLVLAGTAEAGELPKGLSVAAMLGSDFARRHLPAMDPAVLDTALKAAREDWQPKEVRRQRPSLYDDYLGVLASLCASAEPDAPDFMKSEAWAAKSCFTLLGSWAQMRHTFTLHAKEDINHMGLVDVPPGFVEPNPEFFRRLADLVEKTANQLDDAGVFQRSRRAEEEVLRDRISLLSSWKFHQPNATRADLDRLSAEDRSRYRKAIDSTRPIRDEFEDDAAFQKFHREVLTHLEDRLKRIEEMTPDEPQFSSDRMRWDLLRSLTRRLEALAHKQLRKQAWTKEEEQFIRGYGKTLGAVMGYFGNSWLTPRDDAPRWATVSSDPTTETLLAVGVGRPRLIHVLYPWQGTEILCTGAAMSYYEYAGKQRLSDEAWQAALDSKEAPALPKWIEPYLAR